MKRIGSLLMVFILLIGMFSAITIPASAAAYSLDQAMAWCKSQVGLSLDYDKAEGAQCVDLIYYYYEQFGIPARGGNASDYSSSSKVPSEYGWVSIPGATPQKGDIMVWVDGYYGYGHVAICGGSGVYYHQNFNGSYVEVLTQSYTSGFSINYDGYWWANYWGVIRPNFSTAKYTIKYNANGGSGSMSSQTINYGNEFALSKNTFTRTGYTFAGWNAYRSSDKKWVTLDKGWLTESELSSYGSEKKLYKNQEKHTINSTWGEASNNTIIMYAVWEPNTLKVQYNANGGTINSETYKLSSKLVYKISNDAKYVQTWTYNKSKTDGLTNASTFGLSRTGYTFKGWSTTTDGTTIFSQSDSTLVPTDITAAIESGSCTVTLYAVWQPNKLTMNFHANGASIDDDNSILTDGYICKTEDGSKRWLRWSYNITNTLNVADSNFGIYKEGYTFKGWSTDKNGSTVLTVGSKLKPTDVTSTIESESCTVTLYAIWQPNTLNVQFHANGGLMDADTYVLADNFVCKKSTGARFAQVWTYNEAKTDGIFDAATLGLYKPGAHFKGWGTTAEGLKIFKEDDTSIVPTDITTLVKTKSCTDTLYAIWEPHSLVFNESGDIVCSGCDEVVTLEDGIHSIGGTNYMLRNGKLVHDENAVWSNGVEYYILNGRPAGIGVHTINGEKVYVVSGNRMAEGFVVVNSETYAKALGITAGQRFLFEDGKLVDGRFATWANGKEYLIIKGRPAMGGVFEYQGKIVYIRTDGIFADGAWKVTNEQACEKLGIEPGRGYLFDNGVLIHGRQGTWVNGHDYYMDKGRPFNRGVSWVDGKPVYIITYDFSEGIWPLSGDQANVAEAFGVEPGKNYLFEDGQLVDGKFADWNGRQAWVEKGRPVYFV